jgi:hypothetical protein
MKRLQLHPACKLFPELPEDELQQLADDIKANGLRNPVVLWGGKILDGPNRVAACERAGIKPRFVEWNGQGSPIEWVISQNLVRRHLSASQRAVIAHDLLPMLEREAKERQRLSRGRGKKVAKNCATFSENGKASEAAARITKTNARYVEMLKAIGAEAPQLLNRIRAGEINVVEAKRLATVARLSANGKRVKARSAKTKPWKIIADQRVVKCHAVVADPPYGITKQPWEPKNLEVFTRDWCGRWSKCGADLIAIFWSQAKLWEGRRWFDESLKSYKFQQLLVWHAKNYVGAKSRWQFKQTWEPIFLYRRVGSTREIAGLQRLWETELHNLDCHVTSGPRRSTTAINSNNILAKSRSR